MNLPTERIDNRLNEQVAKNLQEVGFSVIDNILGEDWSKALRDEIKFLHENQLLYSNRTYYEGKKEEGKFVYGYSVMKPNVFELDLFSLDPAKTESIPHLNTLYKDGSLVRRLKEIVPELNIDTLDIKVQFNAGDGGCFPMHFDTTQQVSNRQITGTLYLNPDWKPEDGGQLRVYPFPYSKMDIEPTNDRLVLFSSYQTLHRVLPSFSKGRYCVTLWFSSSNPPQKPQIAEFSWLKGVEGIGFILNPSNRKFLSKVIYDNDWRESIEQSFGGQTNEVNKILETHKKEVSSIRGQLGQNVLSFVEECLPLAHGEEFKQHSH